MSAIHRLLLLRAGIAGAAIALAIAVPGGAHANAVDLLWTGTTGAGVTGSSAIVVSNTAVETLTLDVRLTVDSRGVSAVGLSLHFDADLQDELNHISSRELGWDDPVTGALLLPLSFGIRSSQESSDAVRGQLYLFEGGHFNVGPAATTLTFGRVIFVTNPTNVSLDGDDVASGAFAPDGTGSDDGFFDDDLPEPDDITSSVVFGQAHVGPVGDSDGDGVDDFLDNCLGRANPEQIDSDGDGCGNTCDGDYDQNGVSGGSDFAIYRAVFGLTSGQPGYNPNADHDNNNAIGGTDFAIFRTLIGHPPGPSLNPLRDPALCSDS